MKFAKPDSLYFTAGFVSHQKSLDGEIVGLGKGEEVCNLCKEDLAQLDLLKYETQEKIAVICRKCEQMPDKHKQKMLEPQTLEQPMELQTA